MNKPDPSHYHDDVIDARIIDDYCLWVFANCDGETKVVNFDHPMFCPSMLIDAYKSLWRDDWNMDEDKPNYVAKFRQWMIDCGTTEEELEG